MDLTNRILIIGGALLWIFIVLIIILLAWGAPDEGIDRIGDLAGYLNDHNDTPAKLIVTLGGIVLALLAAIIVIIEVAPPEGGSLKVSNVGSSDARIPTDEVAHLLESELRQLPQLDDVKAVVQARGDKAEVSLDLHVGPEADIAATVETACNRASELLSHRIGVALARPPRAQLHYKELLVAKSEAPSSETSSTRTGPFPGETPSAAPPPAYHPPSPSDLSHEAPRTAEDDRPAAP